MEDIPWSEKIVIEPDLGDQRKSIYKALPSPPTTPKRVFVKYRFSALCACLLAAISFLLIVVVVLAGTNDNLFQDHYLLRLNTTKIGQDLIRLEPSNATPTPGSPSVSSRAASLADVLSPMSTGSLLDPNNPDSPFHGSKNTVDALIGNFTTAVDAGLGGVINNITQQVVKSIGIGYRYTFYLQRLCSVDAGAQPSAIGVEVCITYERAKDDIISILQTSRSPVTLGRTTISVPLLAQLPVSAIKVLKVLSVLRNTTFAVLVTSLVLLGAVLCTSAPAILYPHAKILVHFNLVGSSLLALTSFIGAFLMTVLIVGSSFVSGDILTIFGVGAEMGHLALFFLWLAWLCGTSCNMYWLYIWFKNFRKWVIVYRDHRNHSRSTGSESMLGSLKREKGPRVIL